MTTIFVFVHYKQMLHPWKQIVEVSTAENVIEILKIKETPTLHLSFGASSSGFSFYLFKTIHYPCSQAMGSLSTVGRFPDSPTVHKATNQCSFSLWATFIPWITTFKSVSETVFFPNHVQEDQMWLYEPKEKEEETSTQ